MFTAKDYQISCNMVTEGFKQIMVEIDNIAKKIEEDCKNEEVASLVKKLQELEREKLKSVWTNIWFFILYIYYLLSKDK